MSILRETATAHADLWLALGGFLVGFAFGALTLKSNFCTMGALSDIVAFGDWRRFRAWVLAMAVAIAATQSLAASGFADVSKSMYLSPRLGWGGSIVGGALLGFGMIFAGGCPSRNLARAGSGDLRSLITLAAIGVAAYVAIGGLLGPLRASFGELTSWDLSGSGIATQSIPALLAALTGKSGVDSSLAMGVSVSAVLAAFCLLDAEFRLSMPHVSSGIGVGLCIAAGWVVTGLAYDDMLTKPVPPISLTFVRPSGDTLDWLQRFTAIGLPGFGVASFLGALLGAFATAIVTKRFRLQTFADPADTLRNLGGATLMGIGGVMALGCTIGQGITGISTLAIGSLLAVLGIIVGGLAGLRLIERWS